MGFLTGKPQKSESRNKAYGWAMQNYGPMAGYGTGAMSQLGSILGVGSPGQWIDPQNDGIGGNASGGSPGWVGGSGPGGAGGPGGPSGMSGLQNYFNSSGGQFMLNQGLDALTNKFAALGLTKSGAAMKGMEQFRQDLVSTKLDNYLGQLNDMARLSLGAGGLVTGAGQYSEGQGATQGMGPLIGAGLSAIASSSRDLKDDIEELGPWDDRGDGLMKVAFRYKHDPSRTRYVGVIAEDVERLRPAAFVPNFYMGKPGVNYALLGAA